MAFEFGARSYEHLERVDTLFLQVLESAIELSPLDFGIICGHRNKTAQDKAYAAGLSKLQWPHSKHNKLPSLAVDFIPWPCDWSDHLAFARIAGVIGACAIDAGYTTRWGGDWDRDGSSRDQTFMDLGHIELIL